MLDEFVIPCDGVQYLVAPAFTFHSYTVVNAGSYPLLIKDGIGNILETVSVGQTVLRNISRQTISAEYLTKGAGFARVVVSSDKVSEASYFNQLALTGQPFTITNSFTTFEQLTPITMSDPFSYAFGGQYQLNAWSADGDMSQPSAGTLTLQVLNPAGGIIDTAPPITISAIPQNWGTGIRLLSAGSIFTPNDGHFGVKLLASTVNNNYGGVFNASWQVIRVG